MGVDFAYRKIVLSERRQEKGDVPIALPIDRPVLITYNISYLHYIVKPSTRPDSKTT
jgi:hypothetical protein